MGKISPKKCMGFGIIFSLAAVVFAVLYHFNLIKSLDSFLALTYVAYFVGLALMYNGGYHREYRRTPSALISFVLGFLFIILAIVLLVYGLVQGYIVLF